MTTLKTVKVTEETKDRLARFVRVLAVKRNESVTYDDAVTHLLDAHEDAEDETAEAETGTQT